MEKNLLKEEIYRIHEMMGIKSKPILTEGFEDDLIKFMVKNADAAASGTLSAASKVARLRGLGGFSNFTDDEILKLLDDYTKAAPMNKSKALGNIVTAMDGAYIKSIATDIYVNSLDAQRVVGDLLDDYADMWAKGSFADLDNAKAAFEKQLRAGLGDPPPGFGKIYDEIVAARKAGLETRLNNVVKGGGSGSSTVDDVADTETKYYTDEDYNLDKIKAELKKAYNEVYNQGKLPKNADGTPMPQDLGDEFFDMYAKRFNESLTPSEFAAVRRDLIETFGSDPKTLAEKLRVFTKTLGYGPGIAKLILEILTVPLEVGLKLWKKHWKAIVGVVSVATIGTLGYNAYQNYKAGGDVGWGINKGEKLYCWQNNVLTINDFDLETQKKLVDATGIGCEEFDSGDNAKIPKIVTEKESANTGKISYVIEYMDGHKDEYDENFKLIGGGSSSGGGGPFTNDESGFLAWAAAQNPPLTPDWDEALGTGWYKDGATYKEATYDSANQTFKK
jgi:hypothetical protein